MRYMCVAVQRKDLNERATSPPSRGQAPADAKRTWHMQHALVRVSIPCAEGLYIISTSCHQLQDSTQGHSQSLGAAILVLLQ
jgi:hypothetical protein